MDKKSNESQDQKDWIELVADKLVCLGRAKETISREIARHQRGLDGVDAQIDGYVQEIKQKSISVHLKNVTGATTEWRKVSDRGLYPSVKHGAPALLRFEAVDYFPDYVAGKYNAVNGNWEKQVGGIFSSQPIEFALIRG